MRHVLPQIWGPVVVVFRNPNYWENDPFMPENRLPYLDGYRYGRQRRQGGRTGSSCRSPPSAADLLGFGIPPPGFAELGAAC